MAKGKPNTQMGGGPFLPIPNVSTPDGIALARYCSDMFGLLINRDNAIGSQFSADQIAFTPYDIATGATVQLAIQELDDAIQLRLLASAYTAADVLAKLLTVDGAGSLLDADFLDGNSSAFYSPATRTLIAATTRNLAVADSGNVLWNNTGGNVTLTIPTHASVAIPVGGQIDLVAWSTTITVAPAAGVTLDSIGSVRRISPQFGAGSLLQVAADFWIMLGSLG